MSRSLNCSFNTPNCMSHRLDDQYLREFAQDMLSQCRKKVQSGGIYVGSAGCAYLQLVLASKLIDSDPVGAERHIRSAIRRAMNSFEFISPRRVSLLEGRPGPTALLVWAGALLGDASMVASHWHDLISYESRVLGLAPGECEVLYGRSGYLQAVLLASRAAAGARVEVDGRGLCERVVAQIFEEGLRCASLIRDESGGHLDFPLCWKWHDKVYLGAAHGLAGILYTLMLYREQLQLVSADRGLDLVIETIVYVVDNLSHPSGNLYSSARMRDPEDRLVQWCHGAPGLVHLLCLAAETFPHRTEWCLQRAEIACECVWERGLLKKGLGLCHGISGNAYCFVAIARALIKQANFSEGRGDFETAMSHRTKAEMYMLRAHTYAEFMIENFSALKDVPDNPYSLFEGRAGCAALLFDLSNDEMGTFPCYDFIE